MLSRRKYSRHLKEKAQRTIATISRWQLVRYLKGKILGYYQYESEYSNFSLREIEVEIVYQAQRTTFKINNYWVVMIPILIAISIPPFRSMNLKSNLGLVILLTLGIVSIAYNFVFNDSVARLEYLKMKREALIREELNRN